MKVETKIKLNKFMPRAYQLPILEAIEDEGYKRVLAILPRRAGKDYLALNIVLRRAIQIPAVYYYVFPAYAQARKALFASLDSDGNKFLDQIPEELILKINQQEMRIELINNSVIQFLGSDNYDSLRGTNPSFIVYSEYAYQDPKAHQALSPALKYNNGIALFISTVNGKNHMYELYQIALHNPEIWYTCKLTIADTGHISEHEIEREIASGEISWDMAQAEYYSNFELGQVGSYYSKYIDKLRTEGRIGFVPYEAAYKVWTAWDIGNDCTSIIFYQCVGQIVRIIDYYENSGSGNGLEHYAKIVLGKPYIYARHVFPHDMAVTEWGGLRQTRLEKAKQLGLNGMICDKKDIDDGIETVRSAFSRIWIDEKNCAKLIKALENYRQEFDSKRNTYKGIPLHDWSSHPADAMRYLCVSLPKTRDGLSAEDLDKRYRQAMGGDNHGGFFSNDEKGFKF